MENTTPTSQIPTSPDAALDLSILDNNPRTRRNLNGSPEDGEKNNAGANLLRSSFFSSAIDISDQERIATNRVRFMSDAVEAAAQLLGSQHIALKQPKAQGGDVNNIATIKGATSGNGRWYIACRLHDLHCEITIDRRNIGVSASTPEQCVRLLGMWAKGAHCSSHDKVDAPAKPQRAEQRHLAHTL